uniref:ATPase component of ABC transporters with duplicated ATPase domain n=1 Tax=Eubacterium cellulosolvens (strain ATCC 43171 / JCM 9499 / 6) TaxID=633697 RepID=I5AQG7_EUBC6
MVSFSKGSGYSKGDLREKGTPIILYGRLYTRYETVISDVDTYVEAKDGSVYSKGGEVIVPGSGETAEDISIASVVEKSGILLGGDLNIINPPANIDPAFLAISISNGNPHRDMAKMAQGKSVVHLHNADLAKIDLPYPCYEEQRKISSYFASFDNLITLHHRLFLSAKRHRYFFWIYGFFSVSKKDSYVMDGYLPLTVLFMLPDMNIMKVLYCFALFSGSEVIAVAQIQVTDLTFAYDGSADDVLKNVSFSIDTNWKLGLIGRNGKGKTTLLNLFMGRFDYRGSIKAGTCFDYFPYQVSEADLKQNAVE